MSTQPAIASPCIEICVMNEQSGYCRGCFRTVDEIAGWGSFSGDRKAAILRELAARRPTDEDNSQSSISPLDPLIND